jgi:hypothetical protein
MVDQFMRSALAERTEGRYSFAVIANNIVTDAVIVILNALFPINFERPLKMTAGKYLLTILTLLAASGGYAGPIPGNGGMAGVSTVITGSPNSGGSLPMVSLRGPSPLQDGATVRVWLITAAGASEMQVKKVQVNLADLGTKKERGTECVSKRFQVTVSDAVKWEATFSSDGSNEGGGELIKAGTQTSLTCHREIALGN